MIEPPKNIEKKSDKLKDTLLEREKIQSIKSEINTKYNNTKANNDSIYDIISIQNDIFSEEPFVKYNMPGASDDYQTSELTKPFICIGKKSLIVVINFGNKPKETQTNFIKANYKIPINYKAKRLFYKHVKASTEEGNYFIFYTCKVTNKKNSPFYSVTADDGLRISGGKEIFKDFAAWFVNFSDFKNFDDFFGFCEPGIQKEMENQENK